MKLMTFGELNDSQKKEAIELFLIGFGHFMTFSKDEEKKKKLFIEIFDPSLFICYIEDDKVLGLMGLGNNKTRPINFKKEICQKYFGKFKGFIIHKQMNSIFQKKVVSLDSELYLDTLVTHPSERNKGIGTTLIDAVTSFGDYKTIVVEVFSKNLTAIKFYEKNGFIVKKKHKGSLMSLFGSGYPITMVKSKEKQ